MPSILTSKKSNIKEFKFSFYLDFRLSIIIRILNDNLCTNIVLEFRNYVLWKLKNT